MLALSRHHHSQEDKKKRSSTIMTSSTTMDENEKTTIRRFFAGQTVLITGGTGFIGKVLLEKMLRSCPDVGRVYLAIRGKKGMTMEERWENIIQIPLFDVLRKENPEALKKVKLFNADMKDPKLGISEEDHQDIIKNVNIVYHVAATVQFNDNIIDTLEQNTRATYLMVELAKEIENLKIFVYVSTCYTNFFRPESQWDEKLYPPVQDWRTILKLVEDQPLQLAMIKEKLLGGHPNPYTFSKSLAEQIVLDYSKYYKTCIARPSVVMPALEEPLKGWVDSLNGMAVLCIANGLGILRVARHSNEAHQDYVPVDIVCKGLFVVAREAAQRSESLGYPLIYNLTVGDLMKIRTSDISHCCSRSNFIEDCPSKYIVWTRDLKLVKNPVKYQIQFFLEQIIPALILDTAIYLYGAQPLFLKIVKKLAYSNQILFKDFQFSEVHFKNEKFVNIMQHLKGDDKDHFGVPQLEDMSSVKLETILTDTYIGVLKYFFKEDLSEKCLEKNKKRYKRIVMLERTLRIGFYSSLAYFSYNYLSNYFGNE